MKKKQVSKKPATKVAQVSQSKSVSSENATLIVKIISVLGYIGAGFGVLFSLLLLFGGQFILSLLASEVPQLAGALASVLIIVLALVILVFSVLWIFVAKSLWNHKNWARIVVIIFTAIGALNGLIMLPSGIITLLIDGAIIYFLAFDKTVIGLFK